MKVHSLTPQGRRPGAVRSRVPVSMVAVFVGLVIAFAPPSDADDDVTTPTTVPGGELNDDTIDDAPMVSGETTMKNPTPFSYGHLPREARPRPAPKRAFINQPRERLFTIPTDDGRVTQIRVVDGAVFRSGTGEDGITAESSSNLYQTDLVAVADLTNPSLPVYNVDHFVWIATRNCTDPETCTGGVRHSEGFTWFVPITVEVGNSANDNRYGLHGGLAVGGREKQNTWWVDWSGYYGPDHPSVGELPDPHESLLPLAEEHWYRLRVWRVDCAGTGNYGWLLAVKDITTGGAEHQVGTFCLDASTISEAYYFAEVIEPWPCNTDFWGTHSQGIVFRDASGGPYYFPSAAGLYVDNTCGTPPQGTTNLRSPWPSSEYTIDERETLRGSNGGITLNWQQLWP